MPPIDSVVKLNRSNSKRVSVCNNETNFDLKSMYDVATSWLWGKPETKGSGSVFLRNRTQDAHSGKRAIEAKSRVPTVVEENTERLIFRTPKEGGETVASS